MYGRGAIRFLWTALARLLTTIISQTTTSSPTSAISSSTTTWPTPGTTQPLLQLLQPKATPLLRGHLPSPAANIAGLTPCKEPRTPRPSPSCEKQFVKKHNSSLKKYARDSAPALTIQATIEKTKRRFDNYDKFSLLCGSYGLPHLIVSGDQRH